MKKILVAFDGSYFADAALQLAIDMAKREKAFITGVFLEDITAYHQFSPIFDAPEAVGLAEEVIQEMKSEARSAISVNVDRFKDSCVAAGIDYAIEVEEGIPALELIAETQYADICIVGAVTYFSNLSFATESKLLSDLLAKAHCPVVVTPEHIAPHAHTILTYDGSASAVYAIKRYLQLFAASVATQPITLLTVVKQEGEHFPEAATLLQYVKAYCPQVEVQQLLGKPAEQILYMASSTPGSLVVMGGYGRNAFSQLLKSSVGKQVVDARTVPVFVAHE